MKMGEFLDKYDIHILCTVVYAACCIVMSQFSDGLVMLICALLLWMIVVMPLAFIAGLVVSFARAVYEFIQDVATEITTSQR